MEFCVLPWLVCLTLVSPGAPLDLSGVESDLEASLQSTKTYFLTRLNATVTDIVNKGITDVKSLASQGFQVLKSHVDLMDRVLSLLDTSGSDLTRINTILLKTLDGLTADLGNQLTSDIKGDIKTIVEAHGQYLQTLILNGMTSLRNRIADLHLDLKTDLCFTCFNQTLKLVPRALTPMVNELSTTVRRAGHVMSQVADTLISSATSPNLTTVQKIQILLKTETIRLAAARDKVFKEIDATTSFLTKSLK